MARARNIKPSFFQNEELAELSPLARLFFIGLWTEADYKGCVEYRPKRLKVRILPYDDCSTEELTKNLESSGFLRMYSVDGQNYLKIVNFEKHQNPHKNERESGSEIPDFSEQLAQPFDFKEITNSREENGIAPEKDETARADSPFPLTDSLLLIPPTRTSSVADVRREQVVTVFNFWRETLNHPRSSLDAKRRALIADRMKDGYSVEDLCLAIKGCSLSAFHMGQNDTGSKHDGLDLILRDASKVDQFIAKATSPPLQPINGKRTMQEQRAANVAELTGMRTQNHEPIDITSVARVVG